jgi:mRNA interferase RelE/StbE
MKLVILPAALSQIAKLPKADGKRIVAALKQVADAHPQRLSFVTQMVGTPGVWRMRKGNYRAIYRLTAGAMIVTEVGPRKDIYR